MYCVFCGSTMRASHFDDDEERPTPLIWMCPECKALAEIRWFPPGEEAVPAGRRVLASSVDADSAGYPGG